MFRLIAHTLLIPFLVLPLHRVRTVTSYESAPTLSVGTQCNCGCPDCTGQPGCKCGCANCSCNDQQAVMTQRTIYGTAPNYTRLRNYRIGRPVLVVRGRTTWTRSY